MTTTSNTENQFANALAYLFIIGLFIWLCYPIMAFMGYLWFDNASHNNGILIPLVSAYLVWEKRKELSEVQASSSWMGFLSLLFGAFVFIIGILGAERFTQEISMVLLLIGIVWFNLGNRISRITVFPMLFLFLMIPPPKIFYNDISVKLQLFSTKMSMVFLHLLGITVYNDGNVIYLPSMQLEVAEACSGIRSLFSLLTLGIISAYIAQKRLIIRLLLILSTIPIAILFNGLRISGTCILAQLESKDYRLF